MVGERRCTAHPRAARLCGVRLPLTDVPAVCLCCDDCRQAFHDGRPLAGEGRIIRGEHIRRDDSRGTQDVPVVEAAVAKPV